MIGARVAIPMLCWYKVAGSFRTDACFYTKNSHKRQ